jgi:hypothetical protein
MMTTAELQTSRTELKVAFERTNPALPGEELKKAESSGGHETDEETDG